MSEAVKKPAYSPWGPFPEMYSKYFIGQAYLNPSTQQGGPIANVTFAPDAI